MKKMIGKFFWDIYALCYDVLMELRPYREMLERVVKELDLQPGQKILDAGCGTGNLEVLITRDYTTVKITAVDFSSEMLKRARKKCGAMTVNFRKVNLNNPLPFPNGEFDKVICANALYNLDNPEKVLNEFQRILTGGGLLVLITPKKGSCAPLILKAHRHQHEPEEKWRTNNFFKWLWLVFRAFGFSRIAFKFILIAVFNKRLSKTMKVFEIADLNSLLLEQNNFKIVDSQLIYGNQNIFVIAKRR